jgi:hypothetical protein
MSYILVIQLYSTDNMTIERKFNAHKQIHYKKRSEDQQRSDVIIGEKTLIFK